MSFNKSLSMSGSRINGFGFSGATVNMTDAKVYNISASSPGLIIGDNSISGEGQEINVSAVDGGVIDSLTLSGGSQIAYKKIGSGVTVSSGSSVTVNRISSKTNISNSLVSDSSMKTTISGNIIGSIIKGLSVTNSISNKSNQYCYQDFVENEDGTRTLVDRYICEDR